MQKIFLIITFLSFYQLFAMEEVPSVSVMQSYMKDAQNTLNKNKEKGFMLYGKIADISIPSGSTYDIRRKLRWNALVVIGEEVKKLKDQGLYDEIIKIYSYAPRTFSNQIVELQKVLPFKSKIKQIVQFVDDKKFEEAYKILDSDEIKDFQEIIQLKADIKQKEQDYYSNQATDAAKQNNKEKELEWLGRAADVLSPGPEYRSFNHFRSIIVFQLTQAISPLREKGAYNEALKIYKYAPQTFSTQIKQMETLIRFKDEIEQAKQLVSQKKFENALKILDNNKLKDIPEIVELKNSFEREFKTDLIKNYMQKVQQAGNDKEKLEWYGRIANIYLPDFLPNPADPAATDPYKDVRPFNQEAIDKISQAAVDLKNRGDYKEALKVYEYAPQTFEVQIAAIKEIVPFQAQIAQAKQLANDNKFTEALGIIANQLKDIKNLPEIIKLKANIEAKKQEWDKKQAQAPEQKTWIFLRNTTDLPIEKTDWHIIGVQPDARLELNTEAVDPITAEKFVDLIQEVKPTQEKPKSIPFILLGLRTDRPIFYYFYGDSFLQELLTKWWIPETRGIPDAVEIFVVGDDGKLTFLDEMKQGDSIFSNLKTNEQKLKNSGEGHLAIANLFKQKANKLSGKEQQIALQYARQWYDWAMKHLLPESAEYTQAKNERDKIPYKPEILPQEPKKPQEPISLVQALQNLTRSLRQIEAKLY